MVVKRYFMAVADCFFRPFPARVHGESTIRTESVLDFGFFRGRGKATKISLMSGPRQSARAVKAGHSFSLLQYQSRFSRGGAFHFPSAFRLLIYVWEMSIRVVLLRVRCANLFRSAPLHKWTRGSKSKTKSISSKRMAKLVVAPMSLLYSSI